MKTSNIVIIIIALAIFIAGNILIIKGIAFKQDINSPTLQSDYLKSRNNILIGTALIVFSGVFFVLAIKTVKTI